ncbi:uncharacterized protein METZ01_LOCUS511045 [marine metagenome]|uniref:Fe2OG dioxygenase domain-containing protein n=1 Tax=marine metagenome TaxID=408172 RepID=A0A383EN43_9ZZZZ|tara:strand:+ start:128 stop:691 length:564 start_codon:yes stop_codon:yes gene_type:complete
MITIIDNFLENEHYTRLTGEHSEYSKVHWFGRKAEPRTPFHELILKTAPLDYVTGATAWYNTWPKNLKWHNDIDAYCTQKGKTYYPLKHPLFTILYYVKSPETGGELELETGDLIKPLQNRLISFPCNMSHRVKEYKGNRMSIGIIWWFDVPTIWGNLGVNEIKHVNYKRERDLQAFHTPKLSPQPH